MLLQSRQEELLANIPEAESHVEFVQAALRNGCVEICSFWTRCTHCWDGRVVTNLEQKPKVPVQLQLGLKLAVMIL